MRKAEMILILLLFAVYGAIGQKLAFVSGVVRDEKGENVAKATIHIFNSTDTSKIITKNDGTFSFQILQGKNFEILVTMRGYRNFTKLFTTNAEKSLFVLPPIVLSLEFEELAPVMVLGVKPVTIMDDTVEYHPAAFNLRPGAELERLMRRLPGIDWDTGGNVVVDGKKIDRIMINGQDFNAGNVKMALRNLPVDIIDKIQVIDDYGDKARLTGSKSGESEKVLNVILKKSDRNGGIAKLEIGNGNEEKYIGNLFVDGFKANKQFTINGQLNNNSIIGNLFEKLIYLGYSDKWNSKWSCNGSVSIGGNDHSFGSSIKEDNYFDVSQEHQEQSSQTNTGNKINSISCNLVYKTESNTLLRISSFLSSYQTRQSFTSNFTDLVQDSGFVKSTIGNSNNFSRNLLLRSSSNLYFEKTYPNTRSRMSFKASYEYLDNHTDEVNGSHSIVQADSLENSSLEYYLLHINNSTRKITGKLSYYTPLAKASLLELGYAFDYSHIQNTQITQIPDSSQARIKNIDSLSSTSIFSFLVQKFHIGYLTHSNKINVDVGLDAQPGNQNGKISDKGNQPSYQYFNLLPLAQISYTLSPGEKLTFEYTGKSIPPTLQQLNPVEDRSNLQFPVTGNPNLKPSFIQSITTHYEKSSVQSKKKLGLGIGVTYESTQNTIIANLVHPRDTSNIVERTNYINANGSTNLKADYHLNLPPFLHKCIQLTFSGTISTNRASVMTDSIFYSTEAINWTQDLQIFVRIGEAIESMLSGSYAHTLTRYSNAESNPIASSSFLWQFNTRHEIAKNWVLEYSASQAFGSLSNGVLMSNPILLNASAERNFFHRNQATIRLSGNNLFNVNSGFAQVITANSLIQTRSELTSRYFILSILIKLEKFK